MRTKVAVALLVSAFAAGLWAEHTLHVADRATGTTAVQPTGAVFQPAPIRPEWIIGGAPVTEMAEVARTADERLHVYLWRTTAGTFRWIHEADETVTILDGEARVTDADGRLHVLRAGDVALFPSGAVQTWEVPVSVTKTAVLRRQVPAPVEAALRWLRRARGLVASVPNTFG